MAKKDKLADSMLDILDIETPVKEIIPVIKQEILPAIPKSEEEISEDVLEDYSKVRSNLEEISDLGKEAIQQMMEIAAESQHPRAYEVIATLIDKVAIVNDKMMDLQKKMKDLKQKTPSGTGAGSTTNQTAIFVGSTKDLYEAIKGFKKE